MTTVPTSDPTDRIPAPPAWAAEPLAGWESIDPDTGDLLRRHELEVDAFVDTIAGPVAVLLTRGDRLDVSTVEVRTGPETITVAQSEGAGLTPAGARRLIVALTDALRILEATGGAR